MSICSVDDCDKEVWIGGYCTAHYFRARRHGDPLGGRPRDVDSYVAVHRRVARERGPARSHPCITEGCERPAAQWAWQHTGESRTGPTHTGAEGTWGLNVADYEPMCARHHAQFDRAVRS